MEDFKEMPEMLYSAGQHLRTDMNATGYTQEDVEKQVEYLLEKAEGQIQYRVDNSEVVTEAEEGELYSIEITEQTKAYLRKINALCQENGAQLILTKIPLRRLYVGYKSAWTKDKYELVQSLADEYSIPYYDMVYGEEKPDIDYTTDTIDGGAHLNVNGAQKVTQFWAEYFQYEGLTGTPNELYDNMLAVYQKAKAVADFETETSFKEYLKKIKDQDLLVLIAASDEFTNGLSKKKKKRLRNLGLDLAADSEYGASYVAVLDNGEVVYEASSNRTIEYTEQIDGKNVAIKSAGVFNGPIVSIVLEGKEYAVNSRGLNIVLFDKESQKVIDSVAFDTYRDSCNAKHGSNYSLFLEYENWLCDSFPLTEG